MWGEDNMENESKRTAKCQICGKLVEPRALSGHIRFGHKNSKEARELLTHKSAKTLLRDELDKLRADERAGKAVALIADKKKDAELAPPHVYKVEKWLDKTLTTRRKIKELEAMRTVKKGLLDGDDSVDLALKELHGQEAEIVDGFRVIEDAFPSKNKAVGSAWIFFGLAIAALGLPRLIDYLDRKKKQNAGVVAVSDGNVMNGNIDGVTTKY